MIQQVSQTPLKSRWRLPCTFLFLISTLLLLCSPKGLNDSKSVEQIYSYIVVRTYPHDTQAFTQGLIFEQGHVYEGTGLLGRSSLRRVDLQTGRIEQRIDNGKNIFGEGITIFQGRIYQLTWNNKIVFIYDQENFSLIETIPYSRQGWGITNDQESLIASDGSATLYFLDPKTLAERRQITVHSGQQKIELLNELEYINGKIYANIWESNRIAVISPNDGKVEGWIDLFGLYARLSFNKDIDVLNGIMFDQEKDRLFVTGKFWPSIFEIRLVLLDIR